MAEARGVHTERIVRHENVAEEILQLSSEVRASDVVLGRPRREFEENVFSHDYLKDFSQRIAVESGAEVVLVEVAENEAS